MKTLERIFGVEIGWIFERLEEHSYDLIHTRTDYMTADIYTKEFECKWLWARLRRLICVFTKTEI